MFIILINNLLNIYIYMYIYIKIENIFFEWFMWKLQISKIYKLTIFSYSFKYSLLIYHFSCSLIADRLTFFYQPDDRLLYILFFFFFPYAAMIKLLFFSFMLASTKAVFFFCILQFFSVDWLFLFYYVNKTIFPFIF